MVRLKSIDKWGGGVNKNAILRVTLIVWKFRRRTRVDGKSKLQREYLKETFCFHIFLIRNKKR